MVSLQTPHNCTQTSMLSEGFAPGTVVSVTTHLNAGYVFSGWTWNTGAWNNNPLYVLVDINSDGNVYEAQFEPQASMQCYPLNIIVDGPNSEQVACYNLPNCNGNQYIEGSLVTLKAESSYAYDFSGWTGAYTSSYPLLGNISMTSPLTVTAHFQANPTYSVIMLPQVLQ